MSGHNSDPRARAEDCISGWIAWGRTPMGSSCQESLESSLASHRKGMTSATRKISESVVLNPWGYDDSLSWEEAVWTRRVLAAKTSASPAAATLRTPPRRYVCGLPGHLPGQPVVLRPCRYAPGFSHPSSSSGHTFTPVQVPEASLLDYASLIPCNCN